MLQRIASAVRRQLTNLALGYAKAHLGAVSSAALVAVGDMAKSGGNIPAGDWKAIAGSAGLSWLVVAITTNARPGSAVLYVDSVPKPPAGE